MTSDSKPSASRRKESDTTAMGDWATVVDAVMEKHDSRHATPAQAAPEPSSGWELSPRHRQFIETLIGATKSNGVETQQRIHSLVEQVTAWKADVIDTRNAALIMRHNPYVPAATALAMARYLRDTSVGQAMGHIWAGVDQLDETRVWLDGSEREAIAAIVAFLSDYLSELTGRINEQAARPWKEERDERI